MLLLCYISLSPCLYALGILQFMIQDAACTLFTKRQPFFLFSNCVPITAYDVLPLVIIGGSFSSFIEQHSYNNKPFLVWQAAYVFCLERSVLLIQNPLLSIL